MMISEIFGPTVQGEGPRLGTHCGFVRFMACNLSCSWCDTPYTWDASRYDLKKEGTAMTPEEIHQAIIDMDVREVILTGGEPLLQQRSEQWLQLLKDLSLWNAITVETNGTIAPTADTSEHVAFWSVSPKLEHSGDSWHKRLNPVALSMFADEAAYDRAWFKFVAQHPDDLKEVKQIVTAYGVPRKAVWIMPEGIDALTIANRGSQLADAVISHGWNLTTRLHVLTWGNKRGV